MLGRFFSSTKGDPISSDHPTAPKFRYVPLQSPEFFRVLTILPGLGAGPIEGSLTNLYIDSGVQYEALSYYWGDAAADVKMVVRWDQSPEAHVFHVRQNLEVALRRLRYPDRPRSLWIDAICIDQNDEDEKNAQIPRMADIFRNATSVCVWLGEAADESAMAINFIKARVLNLGILDSLLGDQGTDREWAALSKLMRRPWFGRKWVIQEIAFAKEATLHCGNDTISWEDLADAVALFTDHEAESKVVSRLLKGSKTFGYDADYFGDVKALGAAQLVDVTSKLFRKTDNGSIQEHLLSLEYLVSSLATFGASQPHDAIYALLALSRDSWFMPMREKRVSNPESEAELAAIVHPSPGSSSSRPDRRCRRITELLWPSHQVLRR